MINVYFKIFFFYGQFVRKFCRDKNLSWKSFSIFNQATKYTEVTNGTRCPSMVAEALLNSKSLNPIRQVLILDDTILAQNAS